MIPHSRNTCKSRPAGLWGSLSPEDAESLLEQYSHGDSRKPHALRDFLASRFPDYCRSHPVTEEKLKVMNSLLSCKTEAGLHADPLRYLWPYRDACLRMRQPQLPELRLSE